VRAPCGRAINQIQERVQQKEQWIIASRHWRGGRTTAISQKNTQPVKFSLFGKISQAALVD